jgi:hypothetical protein
MRISRIAPDKLTTANLSPRRYLSYKTHSRVTFHGTTGTLQEWAAVLKLDLGTLRNRLNRGWSVERALSNPALSRGQWDARNQDRSQFVTIDGETKRVVDWIKDRGLKASTVWMRVQRGSTIEEALQPGRKKHKKHKKPRCSRCQGAGHNRATCEVSIYALAMRLKT